MVAEAMPKTFFGWRVVGGAFALAAFGWGIGFYGPPVFLDVIGRTRHWPLPQISAAITLHYLVGAATGANLPRIYRRLGTARATKAAALCLAAGLLGWAASAAPWQLFAASLLTGAGWGGMSAAAINGIVSPWFVRTRPAALGMAYNGGSIGGVVFSPLWVAAIAALGFAHAAAAVALVAAGTTWLLADRLFARTPRDMGLLPDGDVPGGGAALPRSGAARALPGRLLWRDAKFLTLAAAMAFGLFGQIGLNTHLFSLLAPALGAQEAGFAMAAVTTMAIAGRSLLGWAMPPRTDRRLLACLGYAAQFAGSVAFLCAGGTHVKLLLLGVVLFGLGFGNATSLPPLVAQAELAEPDVQRAVALIIGMSQAAYAFAPVTFGLARANGGGAAVFAAAALVQGLAMGALLLGRRR
jgi:MFS family permease